MTVPARDAHMSRFQSLDLVGATALVGAIDLVGVIGPDGATDLVGAIQDTDGVWALPRLELGLRTQLTTIATTTALTMVRQPLTTALHFARNASAPMIHQRAPTSQRAARRVSCP